MDMKTSKSKKKIKSIAISISCIILVFVITLGVILYSRLATMSSIEKINNGFYKLTYKHDYNLDAALDAGITNVSELDEFLSKEMYFGFPINANINDYGCSAFLTQNNDSKYLAGRNFDCPVTDTLIIYTDSKEGYSSIGMLPLANIWVSETDENLYSPTSFSGKSAMLAAPYMCTDGVNEKGLSIATLDLDPNETHQDTVKDKIFIPVAVRLLLDRAANVDEAINLLKQYDMHTWAGSTQHLFVSDSSGRAVVIEWHNDDMFVVESPICTNFRLSSKVAMENTEFLCDRFDTIAARLKTNSKNTTEEAMTLLDDVSQDNAYSAAQ